LETAICAAGALHIVVVEVLPLTSGSGGPCFKSVSMTNAVTCDHGDFYYMLPEC